jgi:hypothetical protein
LTPVDAVKKLVARVRAKFAAEPRRLRRVRSRGLQLTVSRLAEDELMLLRRLVIFIAGSIQPTASRRENRGMHTIARAQLLQNHFQVALDGEIAVSEPVTDLTVGKP